jgi:threonine dehydrogenase-like Zn-dependent dehydrogenase
MIRDLYQFKPERPYAPGGEIAGVVEAVGEGVTGFAPGDRVFGGIGNGGLTEKVAVDAGRLFTVPEGVPMEKAASGRDPLPHYTNLAASCRFVNLGDRVRYFPTGNNGHFQPRCRSQNSRVAVAVLTSLMGGQESPRVGLRELLHQ